MPYIITPLFQAVFNQSPEPQILIRAQAPHFAVTAVNLAYTNASHSEAEFWIGKSYLDVFEAICPESIHLHVIQDGLKQVLDSGDTYSFSLCNSVERDVEDDRINCWRQVDIVPIKDDDHKVEYLLFTTRNTSASVASAQNKQHFLETQTELNKELNETRIDLANSQKVNETIIQSLAHSQDRLDEIRNSFEMQLDERTSTLSENEYRLNRIVMSTPVGLTVLKGRELIIEIANLPILQIWGKTLEEVIGKPLMEVFPDLDGQPFPEMLQSVFESGLPVSMPEISASILSANGLKREIYVDFSYNPLFDREGNVESILASVKEVTTQVKAQSQLRQQQDHLNSVNEELISSNDELSSTINKLLASNDRIVELNDKVMKSEGGFRRMIEEAPVAMMVLKGEELIVDMINPAMLSLIDKQHTIIGRPLFEVMPEIEGQGATDLFFDVYRKGRPAYGSEVPVVLKRNGAEELAHFNFTYTPFTENGKIVGIMDVAVEVTDQVRSRKRLEEIILQKTELEETLRSSEQRLQGILDTMAEGVGIIDSEGKMVYANPMAQRILGLTQTEIKERTYHDPKWQNLRMDGTPLPAEEHPMSMVLRTGLPVYDREIAVQPPQGERLYVSVNAAPIVDAQGVVTGGIGTFMDVTNRRKLMIQKDDFISVASHELKTPITTLKASLQLLARLKENISKETLAILVLQANKSLDKLSGLVADLLSSNRISEGQLQIHKTRFKIADLIKDCCQHVRNAGTHQIVLTGNLDLDIFGDEQQLDQVLVNFINNAVKYAPESKQIIISVSQLDDSVKISVSDKGPGIDPQKLQHLFARYYRADYNGVQFSGLGLGLYICSEIVKKHGGEIGVESTLGEGSTFWFTIPGERD